jgi:hypothetical protein
VVRQRGEDGGGTQHGSNKAADAVALPLCCRERPLDAQPREDLQHGDEDSHRDRHSHRERHREQQRLDDGTCRGSLCARLRQLLRQIVGKQERQPFDLLALVSCSVPSGGAVIGTVGWSARLAKPSFQFLEFAHQWIEIS